MPVTEDHFAISARHNALIWMPRLVALEVPPTAQSGGYARGYLAVGGAFQQSGMAYWMVACLVYLYIAIVGGKYPLLPQTRSTFLLLVSCLA
jgi:hypothetical protein